jgi:hypothetical protein
LERLPKPKRFLIEWDNYFINNTVKEEKLPILSLQMLEVFRNIWMATVMDQRRSNEIDFKKEFVIAIFQEASDIDLSYKAISLTQTAPKKLQLTYEEKWGKNSLLRCVHFCC